MATVGFTTAIVKIAGKEYTADKTAGGTISAKITGLGATSNTTYASDVPFYIASKGVSSPKVELEIADLLDGGMYSAMIGATEVSGATVIGANTEAPYASLILVSHSKEGKGLFLGLVKGKFSAPDQELKSSEDKGQELQTDSISGEFIADARGYVYVSAVQSDTMTLEAFKTLVYGSETITPTEG